MEVLQPKIKVKVHIVSWHTVSVTPHEQQRPRLHEGARAVGAEKVERARIAGLTTGFQEDAQVSCARTEILAP